MYLSNIFTVPPVYARYLNFCGLNVPLPYTLSYTISFVKDVNDIIS